MQYFSQLAKMMWGPEICRDYPRPPSLLRETLTQDYRVQEYRLPSPPCNVLRESLSEDSQTTMLSCIDPRGVTKRCRLSLLTNSALVIQV